MSVVFEIDTERLRSDAESLKANAKDMSNKLKLLDDAIASLHGSWQGPAKESFMVNYLIDYSQSETAIVRIKEIGDDLLKASSMYQSCESNVGDMVRSIG